MTRREVIGRYRGSVMGILWSFFNPLLMLAVYTFVFGVVLNARWGMAVDNKAGFAAMLFSGMLVHGLLAECINRAPSLILTHVNFVKKVVFPLEIFCWISLGSTLFHTAVSTVVLLLFALLSFSIQWTMIFLPLVLLPLALLTLGLSWFLAALGVYLRDVGQITGTFTTVLMFLSPVFYPVSSLPEQYRFLLYVNPLTLIIEQVRDVVIWGKPPNWFYLGLYTLFAYVIAWWGLAWFQKMRRGFADVL